MNLLVFSERRIVVMKIYATRNVKQLGHLLVKRGFTGKIALSWDMYLNGVEMRMVLDFLKSKRVQNYLFGCHVNQVLPWNEGSEET